MRKLAIGIDLGGTNLKGIIIDKHGNSWHLTRVLTEAQKGGKHVLENIMKLIETLIKKEGSKENIIGVGIGTPGFVDEDGTVLGGAENLPDWKGTQIYAPIRKKFGFDATAANDVTVTALAEALFGAGKGVQNMVCLALGTGLGGGIIIHNRLYKGTHGMAGEFGHIIVEDDGLPCKCGQNGCVEQYASATGIVKIAKNICSTSKEKTPFVKKVQKKPASLTAKTVYDFVKDRDPVALKVNSYVCKKLGKACGIICNSFAPDRLILGGGVMKSGDLIIEELSKHIPHYCWPAIWDKCDLVLADCGDTAGVLGAGALVFEEIEEEI